jgi:hypothetical protein
MYMALLHKSNLILLPLWEKVPEGRMRGVFQPKAPLTRRFASTSPTRGEVKSNLCNTAHVYREIPAFAGMTNA